MTALPAIVGANIPTFRWLLYLCGGILLISFLILMWDRFISDSYHTYISKKSRKKSIKKYYQDYFGLISKFRVLDDLDKALGVDRLDWGNKRPHFHRGVQSSLSMIQACLEDFPIYYRLVSMNTLLADLIRSFDSWLSTCEGMLQNGHARYKTENDLNRVISLIGDYHSLTSQHDDLCERINRAAGSQNVIQSFYCQKHSFNWSKAFSPNEDHA